LCKSGGSKNLTVPEIGICLEILNHMAINRFGKVSKKKRMVAVSDSGKKR